MMPLTGAQYAERIASYLVRNFGARGIEVYREVPLGKTIIGKNRRIDILVLHRQTGQALAVECKFQDKQGTTDEKIPYALEDLQALRIAACLCYAGDGFSPGIRHLMAASHLAAECLPPDTLEPCEATREFDHILAMTFSWWDLVVRGRAPWTPAEPRAARPPVTASAELPGATLAAALPALAPTE
jgi:hypothetical protein